MSLEKRSTNIAVEAHCEILDPPLSPLRFLAFFNMLFGCMHSHSKELLEVFKRVLVHGIDRSKICQDKEESTDTKANGNVLSSNLFNTFHYLLSLCIRGLYHGLLFFRLGQ